LLYFPKATHEAFSPRVRRHKEPVMNTIHLLIAALLTTSVAGAIPTVQAQGLPGTLPLPSEPTLPPRSDKILVNPNDRAQERTAVAESTGEKLQQLGSQLADAQSTAEARAALVEVVNAATRENGFVDLVGHLSAQDRTRFGDIRREKLEDLHSSIAAFRDSFRAKYQQDFLLKPEHLSNTSVTLGADKKALTVSLSELEKHPAVPLKTPGEVSPIKPDDPAKNIPASTGLSMVPGPTTNLIKEAGTAASPWKVNIPNEISARQLKENLSRHLRKLDDLKTTWSDDPNVTTRAAAAHVLQALNDATLASDQSP
jgi:hypothetical protein